MDDTLKRINDLILTAMHDNLFWFVFGVIIAPAAWLPCIHYYEKLFVHNLKFKDVISAIPNPDAEWKYIGLERPPINGLFFGYGLFMNDQEIAGSANYSKLIEKANTFEKLLNEATE